MAMEQAQWIHGGKKTLIGSFDKEHYIANLSGVFESIKTGLVTA